MAEVARRTRKRDNEQSVENATVSVYTTSPVSSSASGATERHEVLQVRKFITEPAYVRVNAGVTKNMDDYEFLRIDVSVSVPCYVEEIEAVEKEVADMVARMLQEEQDAYLSGAD